eukprot:5266765-Amphidinium_carterae.2
MRWFSDQRGSLSAVNAVPYFKCRSKLSRPSPLMAAGATAVAVVTAPVGQAPTLRLLLHALRQSSPMESASGFPVPQSTVTQT